MKKLIIINIAIFVQLSLFAQQDKHYSLFYTAPTIYNAGAAGSFNGDLQLFTNYRSQWKSVTTPYTTFSAMAESKLLEDKLNGNYIGVSAGFFNDISGDGKLTTNNFTASISYSLEVADNQRLSVGISPGFYQYQLKNSAFLWDQQWDGNTFDNSLSSGETGATQNGGTFDMGAGVFYNAELMNHNKVYAGVSANHITQPNVSLLNLDQGLYRKYTIIAGGEFSKARSRFVIVPNAIFNLQGPNQELIIGSSFKYLLKEPSHYTGYYQETSMAIGGYYRNKDSFYTTFMMNLESLSFGLAYDFNISSLSVASKGRGGVEFMLKYQLSLKKQTAASL